MSRWFTYLLIFLFLFSCTKKETLKISVKNVVTGEPVVGNTISIVEIFNVSDGVSGSKTKDFHSGKTNSEGVLFVTEKFNKNRRYKVKVGKFVEDVCYINKSNENWYVGANTEINFEYAPCAYVKLIINNVNCVGETDSLVLFQGNELGTFDFSSPWVHTGCAYWESPGGPDGAPVGYSRVPIGANYYRWKVIRGGTTNLYEDTLLINAGEFYTYEINY
ncbi:hypothetical protein GCM10009118_23940 [Wandonia haliotis]|uniref:Uncharacterized protein n=1 Tax=Wandonia haliotis TaxID=574963 RepID=A0ABN1MSZ1_9FLAO